MGISTLEKNKAEKGMWRKEYSTGVGTNFK